MLIEGDENYPMVQPTFEVFSSVTVRAFERAIRGSFFRWYLFGIFRRRRFHRTSCNHLIFLVAGAGLEPATSGL
jgi:hypothetical protein